MKTALLIPVLFLFPCLLHAQSSDTVHVFPQFADGRQPDGSTYTSRIWIASIGGLPAACTISLFGVGTDRLASSPMVTVPGGSWTSISSRGLDPIATGFARVDCSQPVF